MLNRQSFSRIPSRARELSWRALLDDRRCTDRGFQIDQFGIHDHLSTRSIAMIRSPQGLHRDIASLDTPGACISENFLNSQAELIRRDKIAGIRPELKYACRFWGRHLNLSNSSQHPSGCTLSFLKEHFLHWLEALSVMGKVFDGLATVVKVRSIYAVGHFYRNTDLRHNAK